MIGYPKWFSKYFITISMFVMSIAGLILIPSTLKFRLDMELPYALPSDARIISTAIHVLFSYLVFLIVGALLFTHVRMGLKKNKNVKSGILMLVLFLFLCLSGLGLFYLSHEGLIKLSSTLHIAFGFIFVVVYLMHLRFRE